MRMGKRVGVALWSILALVLLGGTGAILSRQGGNPADRYLTAVVERGDIEESVPATGVVQPIEYVDVGTQVTGQIRALRVQVGSQVKEGQLVAEIDPTLFAAKVAAGRATVDSLRAQHADRIAQHHLAGQLHERNRALFEADAVSREVFEQSAAALAQAAAQANSFKAQIEQARAQLDSDETNLRYTKIHAPMAGTVVSINARLGQTVVSTQQATVILRIADLRTMTVWAQVSEADVPKVPVGVQARFSTLGNTDRRWSGVARQILPMPETINEVILYDVLFDVTNPDQALKPKMTAQVEFVLARAENALLLPAAALQPIAAKGKRAGKAKDAPKADLGMSAVAAEPAADKVSPGDAAQGKPKGDKKAGAKADKPKTKTFLVRVIKDGQVEEREVRVGITTRFQAEVLSGLAEGETVVVGTPSGKAAGKAKSKDKASKGLPNLG